MEEENKKEEILASSETEPIKKKLRFWLLVNFVLLIFSLAAIFVIFFLMADDNKQEIDSKGLKGLEQKVSREGQAPRILDGLYVNVDAENKLPVAIMIDNHADARPPAGLSEANLVYEAEAEGGITRYLALFADIGSIGEIGPVRSARPYYLEWANEFSALYVHVGGSPVALAKIVKDNIENLNEFFKGEYFWRSSTFSPPHNVFTSGENIMSYLKQREKRDGIYLGWQFKDGEEISGRGTTSKITIDFRLLHYEAVWKYDQIKNNYERWLGDEKHLDADKNGIFADNVIIQIMPAEEIDEKLRLKMNTVGEGRAFVCLDGKCQEANWKKKNKGARTRFYDISEQEIIFNRGVTWVEVVRPEIEFSFE
ncbi:DUF3048 domain-containing protein [bacterium]|nr:DUF3048 domain-containing protein [bacterium]